MTFDQVFDYFGSRGAVARALNITYEAVRQWEYSGHVPIRRQYEIERISNGGLTPDAAKTPANHICSGAPDFINASVADE